MTDRLDDIGEPRLEPWMEARVADAMSPPESRIPTERMWERIAQAPRLVEQEGGRAIVTPPRPQRWRTPALIAAGMLLGVLLGRFAWPGAPAVPAVAGTSAAASPATSPAASPAASSAPAAPRAGTATPSPSASTAPMRAATNRPAPDTTVTRRRNAPPIAPVVVDHLQRTVTVLASVREAEQLADEDSVTRAQLHQLLVTTRALLDDPSARRTPTYRLLQDLELVLAQLGRTRSTAPATRAAADETLRETNLLPRLRAASEGRSGGGAER